MRRLLAAPLLLLCACGGTAPARKGLSGKESPLWNAASQGDLKRVKALLAKGAPAEDRTGPKGMERPLEASIMNMIDVGVGPERLEILKVLAAAGADVNAPRRTIYGGETPLLVDAAVWFKAPIAETLLAAGANPDLKDTRRGWTPLLGACLSTVYERSPEREAERLTVIKALLKGKADPNVGDPNPLMYAALGDRVDIARVLLEGGADPERLNSRGDSARAIARKRGHKEMMRLLDGSR